MPNSIPKSSVQVVAPPSRAKALSSSARLLHESFRNGITISVYLPRSSTSLRRGRQSRQIDADGWTKPLRGAIPRIVAAVAACLAQGFQASPQLWLFAPQQQTADCAAAPGAQGSTASGADAGEAESSRRAIKNRCLPTSNTFP